MATFQTQKELRGSVKGSEPLTHLITAINYAQVLGNAAQMHARSFIN